MSLILIDMFIFMCRESHVLETDESFSRLSFRFTTTDCPNSIAKLAFIYAAIISLISISNKVLDMFMSR